MDPLSIAASVIKITTGCLSAARSLSELHSKYKHASATIAALCCELTVTSASLSHIQNLLLKSTCSGVSDFQLRPELISTFDTALVGCMVVVSGIEDEIRGLESDGDARELDWRQKTKAVWKDDVMKELLCQMHGQQTAITLLVQGLQMESLSELQRHVNENSAILNRVAGGIRRLRVSNPHISVRESIFDSHEAAYSICGCSSITSTEFDFDNVAINSKVYRRIMAASEHHHTSRQDEHQIIEGDLIDLSESIGEHRAELQAGIEADTYEDLRTLNLDERIAGNRSGIGSTVSHLSANGTLIFGTGTYGRIESEAMNGSLADGHVVDCAYTEQSLTLGDTYMTRDSLERCQDLTLVQFIEDGFFENLETELSVEGVYGGSFHCQSSAHLSVGQPPSRPPPDPPYGHESTKEHAEDTWSFNFDDSGVDCSFSLDQEELEVRHGLMSGPESSQYETNKVKKECTGIPASYEPEPRPLERIEQLGLEPEPKASRTEVLNKPYASWEEIWQRLHGFTGCNTTFHEVALLRLVDKGASLSVTLNKVACAVSSAPVKTLAAKFGWLLELSSHLNNCLASNLALSDPSIRSQLPSILASFKSLHDDIFAAVDQYPYMPQLVKSKNHSVRDTRIQALIEQTEQLVTKIKAAIPDPLEDCSASVETLQAFEAEKSGFENNPLTRSFRRFRR